MDRFLNEAIRRNHGPISIATGYFNVAGFAKVRDGLWENRNSGNSRFRLLFGREATSGEDTLQSIYGSDIDETSLVNELTGLTIDEQTARLIDDLINFLRQDAVQI